MKFFLKMVADLLDLNDRKEFIKFVFMLILGGGISLLSIAAVIPLINFLLNPEKVEKIPVIGAFSYLHAILIITLSLVTIFWLKTILSVLIIKKQTRFLFDLSGKIRGKLFKYYLRSPYGYHANKNSTNFISLINTDVNIIAQNIFNALGIVLNETIVSLIIFAGLLFISPVFTITVTTCVFITSNIYMKIFKKSALEAGQERSDSYCSITKCITQSLGSIRETKLYQKENTFENQIDQYSKRISKAGSFEAAFSQSFRYIIEAVSISVISSTLLVYIFMGYSGEKIFTLVSVFAIASIQLLPSANRLIQALGSIRCSLPSLTKVHHEFKQAKSFETHTSKKDVLSAPLSFTTSCRLENIYFSYGTKNILKKIAINIHKGKKIAFVGESGAGKTTIIDIILGLLTPCSGEIFIDNVKLTSQNMRNWQSLLGYIPQTIYLYDSDIRQNIAFGVLENAINDERVYKCLEISALSSFVSSLPDGVFTHIGENGIRLSGGQRQRIGIARALYQNPSVLIMDEATAALDNKTEDEVTQALAAASEDRTIITIAHRISTIMNYDVIYLLHKGRIIASGTYQQLLEKSNEFKRLVEVSTQKK